MSTMELAAASDARLQADLLGPSPLAAGARLQEFEISAVIGQGGFGIVYLARDLSLQRSVAIKEYMPAHLAARSPDGTVRPLTKSQAEVFELGRRSFINEARMLARFKHPGLLEVLRFWEQNGTAYMAMPYYDGATLTQYLKRHPGVASEAWLKKTLKPLVDALGHMHDEDCFHRDVAPDNILILKDGSAVLLDLGAARRVIANDVQAMTVMLKPGYAPIEQYSDDPRFRQGPWTDIYAMAAVFFFAITGKPPPASASRVMRDSVSPLASVRPSGYSESFLCAIDQGLSLQPEDRPRSIGEFRELLYSPAAAATSSTSQPPSSNLARRPAGKQAEQPAVAAGEDPFAPPTPPAPSRSPAVIATLAGALALVAAGAWYGLRPQAVVDPSPASAPAAAAESAASTALPAPAVVHAASPSAVTTPAGTTPAVTTAAVTTPAVSARASSGDAPAIGAATTQPPAASGKSAPAPRATSPVPTAPAAESQARPAAAATGIVVLAIKPWAEVRVDGVARGHSPPLKQLNLPAGRHTIELLNPASPPVKQQIEVRANQQTTVSQQF